MPAGERGRLEIAIARLPAMESTLSLPVEVVHGIEEGPRVWLSGAIHGDELNGVETIRRVLKQLNPRELRGTVLAVPIVNGFGFINESRYLPDRRDLNRSFPGSPRGSLASRIANIFMQEIVRKCTHGIDLHTGSDHRTNLPQIRGNLRDPETLRCARAFRAPLMIHAQTRDGSLRDAASRLGIPILLYEGGEPQRFNSDAIEVGVRGILGVLSELKMIPLAGGQAPASSPIATRTSWIRSRRSGLCRLEVKLGEWVTRRQRLGVISDSFDETQASIRAPSDGLVIGMTQNPLVRQGDGVVHLAIQFESLDGPTDVPPQDGAPEPSAG